MRITKFVHSCLLIEALERVVMIDPGQFSWESGLINVEKLPHLDEVLVTHDHFDHCHKPFLDALIANNPACKITAPQSVRGMVANTQAVFSSTSSDLAEIIHANHASMAPLNPIDPPTENYAYHVVDKLTHPGDSLFITESKDIFCMPLAGPWESAIEAIRLAVKLKPQVVIPIHDWMWNEQWKKDMYARLESFFAEQNIRFIALVDGVSVEV